MISGLFGPPRESVTTPGENPSFFRVRAIYPPIAVFPTRLAVPQIAIEGFVNIFLNSIGVNSKSVMGAGRPVPRVLSRAEMEGHFRAAHDAGLTFSYLFNAPTMGGREFLPEVWRKLEEEIFADFTLEERVLLRRFFLQMRENLVRVTRRK